MTRRVDRPARIAQRLRAAGLSYSPVQQSSTHVPDEEIDALVAALREVGHDGLDRKTLGERVNCRLWGPRHLPPRAGDGDGGSLPAPPGLTSSPERSVQTGWRGVIHLARGERLASYAPA